MEITGMTTPALIDPIKCSASGHARKECHFNEVKRKRYMYCIQGLEEKQAGERLSSGGIVPVSRYQVSAVISAYMKNVRARVGLGTKVRHVSERVEIHISKYNFDDMMRDRIAQETRKKLKES